MYKIPIDIDILKLQNDVVSQITFGMNYILISFNKGSIQFSGSFLFQFESKIYQRDEVYPVDFDFGLLKLLEKKIKNIFCNKERTSLTIEFEGNLVLFLKSDEMYESFEINIDGRRVIV